MEFSHISVLLKETVDGAFGEKSGVYADLTTGGGGHSYELAKRLDGENGGRLICFDQDPEALEAAQKRLAGLPVTFVRDNFRNISAARTTSRNGYPHMLKRTPNSVTPMTR